MREQIDDLSANVNLLSNLYEPFPVVKNEYVSNSNGSFLTYNGWFRSDYIELPENAKKLLIYIPANTQYSAWYDANKTFISRLNLVGGAGLKNFEIPVNARYFAISNEMQYIDGYRYYGNEKMIELFNFLLNDNVINSEQSITFDNKGRPSQITYKRNNENIRVDEILYNGSVITEYRTDSKTGYYITITTNLNTLKTEVN